MMESMSKDTINLENLKNVWHWIFLCSPHYSLITGINQSYKLSKLFKICDQILERCQFDGIGRADCFKKYKYKGIETCINCKQTNFLSMLSEFQEFKTYDQKSSCHRICKIPDQPFDEIFDKLTFFFNPHLIKELYMRIVIITVKLCIIGFLSKCESSERPNFVVQFRCQVYGTYGK